MRRTTLALAAALLGVVAHAPLAAAAEPHTASWYVLRQKDSFQCWPARVIRVNGTLATGSAAIAGGPFETREAAERHIAELADRGTCRSG